MDSHLDDLLEESIKFWTVHYVLIQSFLVNLVLYRLFELIVV